MKDKTFVDKKSTKKYVSLAHFIQNSSNVIIVGLVWNGFIFDNFLEDHHNEWQKYSQAATQGGSQQSPMTQEELWIKENLDKKDRVYGFGMEGVKLKN